MGLFIKRPGEAAFCFARCCGIDTVPPGHELKVLTEAILLFGFASDSLTGEAYGGVRDKAAA